MTVHPVKLRQLLTTHHMVQKEGDQDIWIELSILALPRRQTFGPLGILWRSFIIRKCSPLTLETKDLEFLKLPIVSPWLTQPICILGKAHQSVYTPKWFRGNIRDTASPLLACSLLFPFSHSCLAKLFSQNQRFSKPVCLRTAMTFQGIVWKSWVPLMFICLYLLRKFCVICVPIRSSWGFPGGSVVKNLPASAGDTTWVRSLGWEDPPEKDKATHSCTFAGIIPRTEETCGLQSMGSQRIGHDWTTAWKAHTATLFLYIKRILYVQR